MGGRLSRRRVIRSSTILTDDEARIIAKALREYVGEQVGRAADSQGFRFDDFVRLSPLGHRFREQREKMGLTIKDVATQIRVPQYRLKEMEKAPNLQPEVLHTYAAFLGLESWLRRWAKASSELAERMGISRPVTSRAPSKARGGRQVDKGQSVHRFKIQLLEIEPPIWRRIEVPSSYTFWDLHVAIQDVMGWLDYHLHAFRIRHPKSGKVHEVGLPDEHGWAEQEILPGWQTNIADYFSKAGKSAEYEYDFGDSWQHAVLLEEILPKEKGTRYPRCLGGERACPPEDCGGVPGYEDLLEVIKNPSAPEYMDTMTWLGPGYDPDRFNVAAVHFDDPRKRWKNAFG